MARHLSWILGAAVLASPLAAQEPAVPAASARIVGTVHDSIDAAPLRGAVVQLVSTSDRSRVVRSVRSGPDGAFTLADVPAGRYTVGFLHPLLDSLGIDAPGRELAVAEGDRLRVDLATPSPARLGVLLCSDSARAPSAVQVGVVRSATDRRPVAGAVVEGGWREYAIRRGALGQGIVRIADTTDAEGRYRLCGVPRGGTVTLRVTSGVQRSAPFDVDVPTSGVGRRDLYVGREWAASGGAIADAAASGADDVELLVGDGSLRGRVLDREFSKPIAGARVGIVGGHEVRSDASGGWSLEGIPSGTRVLEVRAVGYAPTRVMVDVFSGAPPVELRLATVEAMLDTIRVVASRERLANTGFEQRRRQSAGHFLTTKDILRRPVQYTSQALVTVPGLRVDRTTHGNFRITMPGFFGRCFPAVYIDGHEMRDLNIEQIDAFVTPDEVAGIEIYSEASVPAEFNQGFTPAHRACGSIVIWRKMGENPARGWTWARRIFHGVGAVALGFGMGAVMLRM